MYPNGLESILYAQILKNKGKTYIVKSQFFMNGPSHIEVGQVNYGELDD